MKVLVGVDLTVQGHEWLLERASHIAGVLGGRVDLVFITSAPTTEHKALLQGLMTLLPEACRGESKVVGGEPADSLVTLTPSYDLMIIGPREPSALQRWLLGPMAVRVLKRSRCPILVPRRESPFPTAPRMIAGVDVRGLGVGQVLSFSVEWAKQLGGTVHPLFAAPAHLPAIRNKEVREHAVKDFLASLTMERAALDEIVRGLPEAHRGEGMIDVGEPEDVLVRRSKDFDLLLVGNRGRTGLTRLLMGNVANHVVRSAHCDVLVLPTASRVESSA